MFLNEKWGYLIEFIIDVLKISYSHRVKKKINKVDYN